MEWYFYIVVVAIGIVAGIINTLAAGGSLLTFPVLLDVARTGGFLSEDQITLLADWREDPFGWGEKHGFPKAG